MAQTRQSREHLTASEVRSNPVAQAFPQRALEELLSSRAPVSRFPNERRRSQFPYGAGKVKNSHMGGAETAAPGRFFTPRPSKVNRSTLGWPRREESSG